MQVGIMITIKKLSKKSKSYENHSNKSNPRIAGNSHPKTLLISNFLNPNNYAYIHITN